MKTLTFYAYEHVRCAHECNLTDEEYNMISSLTSETLFNFAKDVYVNKLTPSGETKAIFKFGKFRIYLYVRYYFWSKRYDEGHDYMGGPTNNTPMTEQEWNELFPDVDYTLDVLVEYDNQEIIDYSQMSFVKLVETLKNMIR